MTREEAIKDIQENIKPFVGGKSLDMAIKALEQQPCEDCISREDAIKQCGFGMTSLLIADNLRKLPPATPRPCGDAISRQAVIERLKREEKILYTPTGMNYLIKAIEEIPPVTPQPKTVLYSGDGYMVYDMAECPNCGYEYEDGDKDWGLPFCPGCGQSLNWESEVRDEDNN